MEPKGPRGPCIHTHILVLQFQSTPEIVVLSTYGQSTVVSQT